MNPRNLPTTLRLALYAVVAYASLLALLIGLTLGLAGLARWVGRPSE